MGVQELVLSAAQILEVAGVAVIVAGVALVSARVVIPAGFGRERSGWYVRLRQGIGRAILLGLELLVGADIIRTVAEVPTLADVAVLGAIVLIRTLLSFTLQVEIEGRWPWQRARGGEQPTLEASRDPG